VLRIFIRAVRTTLCRTSPDAPRVAQLGALSFLHRFGSSLDAHFHFHAVVLDGVFSPAPDGEAHFHEAALLPTQARARGPHRDRSLRFSSSRGSLASYRPRASIATATTASWPRTPSSVPPSPASAGPKPRLPPKWWCREPCPSRDTAWASLSGVTGSESTSTWTRR
jgi:hypothetical protein